MVEKRESVTMPTEKRRMERKEGRKEGREDRWMGEEELGRKRGAE